MLHPGLYEQVINNQLNSELSEIPEACKAVAPIDKAEASKVLTLYLADVVQKGLDNVLDNGGDHEERGSKVLLFVREFKSDRMTGGAEAYTFLGTARYVKHEGSRPMNITWQLDRPIPAKFLKKTNKLVVG